MNKILNIAGKIILGICAYGVYRKTYEWGMEYISKDVENIVEGGKAVKDLLTSR